VAHPREGGALDGCGFIGIAQELVLIGELAKRSRTTTKAIRIYEARGLVGPVLRAANRYRYFDASLTKIVPVFTSMLSLGLALRDICAIFAPIEPLRTCPSDASLRASMRRAEPIYRRHIEAIDAEMIELAANRRAFEVRLERCRVELETTGVVELPEPFVSRRQMRPGRVAYERLAVDLGEQKN
jgi:MerR family transcriptional regulator, copper efflux regulator